MIILMIIGSKMAKTNAQGVTTVYVPEGIVPVGPGAHINVSASNMTAEVLTPSSLAGLAGLPISRVKERSPWQNMMIYAVSGWGKTWLGGSAQAIPGMSPVLSIDAEGGSETLRNPFPDVEVVRITNWEESVN